MNKFLWLVTDLKSISRVRQKEIVNFLFPLQGFCVGFIHTFTFSQIKEDNSYLYINCILENEDIENLKKLFLNIPSHIKGVLFEDVGLINVLKDLKLEKILYLNHYPVNYASINAFLTYVDSLVIPFDLTLEEITEILDKTTKKLCVYGFGMLNLMYSRRKLLTNYQENYQLKTFNKQTIQEKKTKKEFKLVENERGIIFYTKDYYNALEVHHPQIKYIVINSQFLTKEQKDKLLIELGKKNYQLDNLNISQNSGFLKQKTFYKLK